MRNLLRWPSVFLTALAGVLLASGGCAHAPAIGRAGPPAVTASVPDPRPGAKPILILVSLDGWRWDYLQRLKAPHLKALAARGVLAQGLIPVFPSKTYPSHFTTVTGLYPEHHGIIANNIVDATISSEPFTMTAGISRDPRWWGGEPMWLTAISQGLRASSMFWPGSDVAIGGVRPTEWLPYDHNKPNGDRVTQVLTWLARPEAERPSFVTLYFSDVDTAGHIYGPGARETLAAAEGLDAYIGRLVAGLETLSVLAETTLIVVSDHGMSQQAIDRKVFIDDYIDLKAVDVSDWSPVLQLRPKSSTTADEVYRALLGKHPSLAVYRREEVPKELHYSSHPRIAPVIAIAAEGWQVTTRQRFKDDPDRRAGGDHGYDPRVMQMHGLFVAAGPTLRQGLVVPRFENVHIYELMCRVLGLRPAKNDGDPAVTAGWMRSSAARTSAWHSPQSVPRLIPGS